MTFIHPVVLEYSHKTPPTTAMYISCCSKPVNPLRHSEQKKKKKAPPVEKLRRSSRGCGEVETKRQWDRTTPSIEKRGTKKRKKRKRERVRQQNKTPCTAVVATRIERI